VVWMAGGEVFTMLVSLWSSEAAMTAGRFLGRVVSLSSVEFLRGAAGSSNMSLELLLMGLTES